MSEKLFITRKRKKYKFAKFNELPNCYQFDEWLAVKTEKLPNNFSTSVVPSKRSEPCDIPMPNGGDPVARSAPLAGKTGQGYDVEKCLASFSHNLVVEIGAGTGLFSVELARRHPKKFFICVDIKSDRLYTGAKLADELGLENIVFIRSDIWRLGEIVPSHSISEIWLTFSDPYPRKSDARHRLTSPRFLEIYKNILSKESLHKEPFLRNYRSCPELRFKTDNEKLFDWSTEQLQGNGWEIAFLTRDLHSELDEPSEIASASHGLNDAKIMTTYEKRFVAEGLPILYLSAIPHHFSSSVV